MPGVSPYRDLRRSLAGDRERLLDRARGERDRDRDRDRDARLAGLLLRDFRGDRDFDRDRAGDREDACGASAAAGASSLQRRALERSFISVQTWVPVCVEFKI